RAGWQRAPRPRCSALCSRCSRTGGRCSSARGRARAISPPATRRPARFRRRVATSTRAMRRCAIACAALLAWLPAAGRAQQDARATLAGVVRDAATGELLAGVLVRIEGSDLQALTDSAGRYRLPRVPAGVQVLRAERLGYAPARITLTVPLQG